MKIFSVVFFLCMSMYVAALSSAALGMGDEKKIPQETHAVYIVGERPQDTVCADLNGDGFIDIVTSVKKQALSVLLNNKKGGYDVSQYKSLPHNTSVAAADVDVDGDIDIVLLTEAMFGPVFLNNGRGQFASSDIAFSTLMRMSSHIQTSDFNNDSLPDFAVTSSSENVLLIFINEGDLKFRRVEFPLTGLGRNPFSMAVRESKKNKPKKNEQEKTLGAQPLAGMEDGTIKQGQKMSEREIKGLTISPPERSEGKIGDSQALPEKNSAEMEQTKQVDLPYLFTSEQAIKRVNGIKHFLVADLNGDGYDDVVLPNYVLMRLYVGMNDGKGNFTFTVKDLTEDKDIMKEEHFSLSSIAAIRNGDKAVRFVAVAQESPGRILIFRNEKGILVYDYTINLTHSPALRIVAAEFNDDGFDDLAVAYGAPLPVDNKSPIAIYLQDGKGGFALAREEVSDGYAAYINACRLDPNSKDFSILLSNIHEHKLTILNIPSSSFSSGKTTVKQSPAASQGSSEKSSSQNTMP